MVTPLASPALRRRQDLGRLEKKLLGECGRCNKDFDLISEGDRILVGVSGGKDSYTLLHLLRKMRERAPVRFDIVAMTLDQGHPGFEVQVIQDYMDREGVEFRLVTQDTYSIVLEKTEPGKTFCSLCSRLRRGIIYRVAGELGCNKIALGHHRDDAIETLLLNLFYAGQLKAMPPWLRTDSGRFEVIRPLSYSAESTIAQFAALMEFPILPCNLCGSQEGLHRQKMKALLAQLSSENPNVAGNLFAALGNVVPGHLLDRDLVEKLGGR